MKIRGQGYISIAHVALAASMMLCGAGCLFVPRAQFDACQAEDRVLREQNRAQLAEIEDLRNHSRKIEDQLAATEQRLAIAEEQVAQERGTPRAERR